LRDHDRRLPGGTVGVRGIERMILSVRLLAGEVDAVAGGVAADRGLMLPGAEQRLVAAVGAVLGALVAGQLDVSAGVPGGVFEVGPEAAGADGVALPRVADLDQPRPDSSTAASNRSCSRVDASAASS
jgi:hypothetical protein